MRRLTLSLLLLILPACLTATQEWNWEERCQDSCEGAESSCAEWQSPHCAQPACAADCEGELCRDPGSDFCQLHAPGPTPDAAPDTGVDVPDTGTALPDTGTGLTDTGSGTTGGEDAMVDAESGPPDAQVEADAADPCDLCQGDTPHCSEDGDCVECQQDAHCEDGLLCAPDSNACVACNADTDCDETAPVCDDHVCAACASDTQCARFADTPLCATDSGACVTCNADSDCTDPAAARCMDHQCVPCTESAQCAGLAGTEVCEPDSGTCVQCTAAETAACGNNVCASRTATIEAGNREVSATQYQCVGGVKPGDGAVCGECLSDPHCGPNALCMPTTFKKEDASEVDAGWFCLQKPGPSGCALSNRPYVNTLNAGMGDPVASLDGATEQACTLALTTCPALNQFRSYEADDLCADATDHDACGIPELQDGFCQAVPASSAFACSVPCLSDSDCEVGATCTPNSDVGRKLCTF